MIIKKGKIFHLVLLLGILVLGTPSCGENVEIVYSIGGTISNLGGNQTVVLQNNSGDNLTLTGNGTFKFAGTLPYNTSYAVTVLSNPSRQICTVGNGNDTVNVADVTNIIVACVTTNPRIFTTSSAFNGNLKLNGGGSTGIAGADVLCSMASNKPITGTYKALIVDGVARVACSTDSCGGGAGEHVDWVLAANTTYFREGGIILGTTTSNAIFTFNLTNSFGTSGAYWTGLTANWRSSIIRDCSEWERTQGDGNDGDGTAVNSTSIFANTTACISLRSLLCVEQ